MQRDLDPSHLPPNFLDLVNRATVPLVTDTWECPRGHRVKTVDGNEPRLSFGPNATTPKPVCLHCWLQWLADNFPISKKENVKQEEFSSIITP